MKKYKYKAKDYRKKVKKYWKRVTAAEDIFWGRLTLIEQDMAKDTGIKDIEFIWGDGSIIGIGNVTKTMELINRR